MRRFHAFAKTEHGKGECFIDTAALYGVVGREEVPAAVGGAPLGDVGVVVVFVEMGDDEINLFVGGVVQQWEEYAVGVEPVVEHYEAVFLFGHETAMVYVVQFHWGGGVRVWGQSLSLSPARRSGCLLV